MFVIPPRNPFYQAASDRQLKAGIYGGQHQSAFGYQHRRWVVDVISKEQNHGRSTQKTI